MHSLAPEMERLGIVPAIKSAGGIPNGIDSWTPFGWIRPPDRDRHGWSLRRSALDPIVRGHAIETVGVEYMPGFTAVGLEGAERITGVRISGPITKGENVLVLGTTSGTTITASKVVVQPTGSEGSQASSAAGVVPFQRGAKSTSKQVGQIPTGYSQGSGTIVSGTAANKATEAALAAYPGGVIDRVVKLSNGEYEVHNIGVNWPHHIFVNQDFKVLGAD
jgi:hypothetical protein